MRSQANAAATMGDKNAGLVCDCPRAGDYYVQGSFEAAKPA
jgi:hypothetical protein